MLMVRSLTLGVIVPTKGDRRLVSLDDAAVHTNMNSFLVMGA